MYDSESCGFHENGILDNTFSQQNVNSKTVAYNLKF